MQKNFRVPSDPTRINIWEFLWKVNQVVIPLGIAWSIWVTTTIFELKARELGSYSKAEAIAMETQIKDWSRNSFSPVEVNNEIKVQMKELNVSIKAIESQMEGLRLEVLKIQIGQSQINSNQDLINSNQNRLNRK